MSHASVQYAVICRLDINNANNKRIIGLTTAAWCLPPESTAPLFSIDRIIPFLLFVLISSQNRAVQADCNDFYIIVGTERRGLNPPVNKTPVNNSFQSRFVSIVYFRLANLFSNAKKLFLDARRKDCGSRKSESSAPRTVSIYSTASTVQVLSLAREIDDLTPRGTVHTVLYGATSPILLRQASEKASVLAQ